MLLLWSLPDGPIRFATPFGQSSSLTMSTGYTNIRVEHHESGPGARRLAETSAQPSFNGSSSSLPGALGLGAASPQTQQPASYANAGGHWTRYGSDAEQTERSGSHDRSGSLSAYSARGSFADAERTSGSAAQSSRLGSSDGYVGAFDADRRTGSSASNASAGSFAPPRTFLVPVGATGARQKLNIMSAARRPRTSGATEKQSNGGKIDRSSISPGLPRTASGSGMGAGQIGEWTWQKA